MLQLPTDVFLELYSNTDKIESSDLCSTCTHCAYCQAIPDAVGNSETREVVQCYCYSKAGEQHQRGECSIGLML